MAGFSEIVGHDAIISHLQNAIRKSKIGHAYILDGPEHSGKHMLAEAFAQTLQCEAGGTEPCGSCHSCRQAQSGNHPDIIHVTHEKPNTVSVGDIRHQLGDDIDIRPYNGRHKVYIIDDAQKMNIQAQNALLKTIEEPPEYAVILLLTDNADHFLPTILSRCVLFRLKAVDDDRICAHLVKQCAVPDYKARICASFAQGNVGRAMDLAVSEDFARSREALISLLQKLSDFPVYRLAQEVRSLTEDSDRLSEYFDLLMLWFRDLLFCKSGLADRTLVYSDQTEELRRQANLYSTAGIGRVFRAIRQAQERIRANVNKDYTLELLFIDIQKAQHA